MTAYRIALRPSARRQLEHAISSFRMRSVSPSVLREELKAALVLLSQQPEMSPLDPDNPGIRRRLLPRCQYYVYYRVTHEHQVVEVIAIWSTSRERGPLL